MYELIVLLLLSLGAAGIAPVIRALTSSDRPQSTRNEGQRTGIDLVEMYLGCRR